MSSKLSDFQIIKKLGKLKLAYNMASEKVLRWIVYIKM